MSDAELNLIVFAMIVIPVIIFQQIQIMGLRRRFKRLSTAPDIEPALNLPPPPSESPEVERLRQRVQVLERIATDGSPSLERELAELRDR